MDPGTWGTGWVCRMGLWGQGCRISLSDLMGFDGQSPTCTSPDVTGPLISISVLSLPRPYAQRVLVQDEVGACSPAVLNCPGTNFPHKTHPHEGPITQQKLWCAPDWRHALGVHPFDVLSMWPCLSKMGGKSWWAKGSHSTSLLFLHM